MTALVRPFLFLAFVLGLASANPALRADEMSVERRVARLDTLVQLSAEQCPQVTAVFEKEQSTLARWPQGRERLSKEAEARQQSRAAIRALLTTQQRKKYDAAPQSLGGARFFDPANIVERLDRVVGLKQAQKKKVFDIVTAEMAAQSAAPLTEEKPEGFAWNDAARAQLRALLTPEQQAKFDATKPFKGETRPASASK